ncbi:hypothetical protein N656DRAFT_784652 [Canariomyces notabilis]|uniref:Uncharacterized protein n=1 Tax=Canariomyces notabilis TaxID=2074819 RepID=A0AAN6QEF6_9PEZI|nr:hypothetical protein N656DRAFT_784652 [Canariomyces arenarius]
MARLGDQVTLASRRVPPPRKMPDNFSHIISTLACRVTNADNENPTQSSNGKISAV